MREYLQIHNLRKAIGLGGLVALAAVPRILSSGGDVWVLGPTAFLSMTLVAGAVMAWGQRGGMVGAFPATQTLRTGLWVALVLGLMLGLGRWLWGSDAFRDALVARGQSHRVEMNFPSTLGGKLALVFWVAGFQVLFFQAGAMSFLARLLGRWELGLMCVGGFRVMVIHAQMNTVDVSPILAAYWMPTFTTLVGATLFARFGLPAAVVFAFCIQIKTLLA